MHKDITEAFKYLLKSPAVNWEVQQHNHMDGNSGYGYFTTQADTTLKVRAFVCEKEAGDSITRLQALQIPGAYLTDFSVNMAGGILPHYYTVNFTYKIGDIELFGVNLNKFIREQYDYQFTEALETELTSP